MESGVQYCSMRGGRVCWMKRKASRERGRGDEDEGGVVGRPAAERKGQLLRLDCSLSGDGGAAHSDRIWPRPVQRLHLRRNQE